jgi:hypothetical protein
VKVALEVVKVVDAVVVGFARIIIPVVCELALVVGRLMFLAAGKVISLNR